VYAVYTNIWLEINESGFENTNTACFPATLAMLQPNNRIAPLITNNVAEPDDGDSKAEKRLFSGI
jgi:hypothetical protein